MPVDLKIPEVGESITEVQIGEWLKAEGDVVATDENVVTIESEKATVELPAPTAGRLTKILKQKGETVKPGQVIAQFEKAEKPSAITSGAKTEPSPKIPEQAPAKADDKAKTSEPKPKAAAKPENAGPKEKKPSREGDGQHREESDKEKESARRVMPAAQRLLAEHGLRAEQIKASGPGGRLLKEDVLRHVESSQSATTASKPAAPASPSSGAREEEVVPMTLLRRTVARRLVEAQHNAALLTTFNEIDMSSVSALRKEFQEAFQARYKVKLGFMSFFVKATVEALKQIPQLNAEVRETDIVYHNYCDVGIAIGGGKGLVVPVLRNAERLSFAEIEKAIADFAQRAQENKLKPEELQGGTFTITNGGIYGSLLSTPIINPPQSGILGMHAIQDRPVALEGNVVIRPMMYVALTYDHRVVDGREAVTFLRRIKEVLEKPARMLIEI